MYCILQRRKGNFCTNQTLTFVNTSLMNEGMCRFFPFWEKPIAQTPSVNRKQAVLNLT